jgi:hypothetical protein
MGGRSKRDVALPRILTALVCAVSFAQPAPAQTDEPDSERNWELAREVWQRQAEAGSPKALLGLGRIAELGVFGPPDPAEALRHYRAATEAGLAEGAFAAAEMLASDPETADQAELWYSCAALAGHEGARDRLDQRRAAEQASRGSDAGAPEAPRPLGSLIIRPSGERRLCLAWEAQETPLPGTLYHVVLVDGTGAPISPPEGIAATGSAVDVPVPAADDALWRVLAVDPAAHAYAASAWIRLDGTPAPEAPLGQVDFRTVPGDARAERLVRRIGSAMAGAGVIVSFGEADVDADESRVTYVYEADAGLAGQVAEFFPGSPPVLQDPSLSAAPGEVIVTVVFDR